MLNRPLERAEQGTEMKSGDVYRFTWKDQARPGQDPYWCFDGQLVAVPHNGGLLLVDTYWGFGEVGGETGKTFTLERAFEIGNLEFVCNLGDLEPAQRHEVRYYDEADLFDLSYQHRCYFKLMKRKGAKKSREAMYRALAQDRKEADDALRAAIHKLEWVARTRQVVEDASDVEKLYP